MHCLVTSRIGNNDWIGVDVIVGEGINVADGEGSTGTGILVPGEGSVGVIDGMIVDVAIEENDTVGEITGNGCEVFKPHPATRMGTSRIIRNLYTFISLPPNRIQIEN
jgi:hypothetical protein